jgi:hypothetical protein
MPELSTIRLNLGFVVTATALTLTPLIAHSGEESLASNFSTNNSTAAMCAEKVFRASDAYASKTYGEIDFFPISGSIIAYNTLSSEIAENGLIIYDLDLGASVSLYDTHLGANNSYSLTFAMHASGQDPIVQASLDKIGNTFTETLILSTEDHQLKQIYPDVAQELEPALGSKERLIIASFGRLREQFDKELPNGSITDPTTQKRIEEVLGNMDKFRSCLTLG